MTTRLTGRVLNPGKAEGDAIVCRAPFSFFLDVNTETGEIIEIGHEHQGKSIKGKILIYPFGKGSSGDCLRLWRCANNKVAPAGIINLKPDVVHVQGAIIANVPMICVSDGDPISRIATGDFVRMDGAEIYIVKRT
jgi:predicted aconitase with swiveling domain